MHGRDPAHRHRRRSVRWERYRHLDRDRHRCLGRHLAGVGAFDRDRPRRHVVVPTASGGGGTAAATKLSIVKRVSRASAYPGQKLTYTLTVTNDGPTTATDVEVTDSPSIPIKIISIRPQQGSCRHSQGITCSLGTVLVGQTVKVTINGQVERSGTELNTARVTSAELPLDPASMVATAATKVTPILQIHKSPSVGHAVTGQNITYRITVTNPTLVAISKVTVCDSLPSGLLYLSSSPGAAMRRGRPCWSIAKLPQDARNGSRWSRTSPPATAESSSTALTRPRQGSAPPAQALR